MDNINSDLVDEFEIIAEDRGDDPDQVLEQLITDYIHRQDHLSKIDEIHTLYVSDGLQADIGNVHQSLDEYDPETPKPISKDALRQISDYRSKEIAIDRDDVREVPQNPGIKRSVIYAAAIYEYDDIRKDELVEIADDIVGVDSDYLRQEYVEKVWDQFIQDGYACTNAFTSKEALCNYLDKIIEADGDSKRRKVDQITNKVIDTESGMDERMNNYRSQVGLDKIT